MAQFEYKPRKIPQVLSLDWINQELAIIADRHNFHYYQSFPDKCVPLFAMKHQYGNFVGVLQSESHLDTAEEYLYFPISVACTWLGYSCTAHATAGTTTFTFAYTATRSPALSWSNAHTATAFGAGYTANRGTVDIDLVPGDSVRLYINAGAGTVTRATGTIWFKAKHTI